MLRRRYSLSYLAVTALLLTSPRWGNAAPGVPGVVRTVPGAPVAGPAGGNTALPCEDGECPPVISQLKFQGRAAYRLTDGRSEAVIVPELGRVMHYGLVGGPNLLWTATPGHEVKYGSWVNYGGDKTWLAPQSSWSAWHARTIWPPDPSWELNARANVESGGKLRLTYPLSATSGTVMTRLLYFDTDGDFVVEQAVRKTQGPPINASIWSITQVVPGDAIFLPVNANSPYKKNFHWLYAPKNSTQVELVNNSMVRIKPSPEDGDFKIGVDSPVSSLVSVRDRVVFLQRSARPAGNYPDGADGAGFPVELFVKGDPRFYYAEMEILSPVLSFRTGSRWIHTVRWSLHALPAEDIDAAENLTAIEELLLKPMPARKSPHG